MKVAMHVGLAGSLLLASMAEKCDCDKPTPPCKMNCSMQVQPPIDTRRKCKYIVNQDKLYEAIAPSIFQMNIGDRWNPVKGKLEKNCDWKADQAGFLYSCEECAQHHAPCNNSYAGCGGCGCMDPNYAYENGQHFADFMDDLGDDPRNLTTYLTCEDMKEAYMNPNYNVVQCEEENEWTKLEPQGNISAIRVDVEDGWNASAIESGFIHGGCLVYPEKLGCQRVPLILKFECDDCVSQGSREMLTKCCTKCKEFVDGLESNPLIPDNILPLGFCSGCNVTEYTFEDSPMPEFPPAPWRDYKKFKEYTEDKALEKFETYIHDSVCTHLTKHCDETTDEECHNGCCPADPGVCGANGCCHENTRRLEFMEPVSQKKDETQPVAVEGPRFQCASREKPYVFSPETKSPEPVDNEPKAVIKTTMALPGTMEMYQTDEAKTALRHGFANTLPEVPETWITVSVNAADGGRRLSAVSAEFTINVPSTSSVTATEVSQSVESIAVDNGALATNLHESFAEHAAAVDVSTVDFNEATVSEPEIMVIEESSSSKTTESTTGSPSGIEDVPDDAPETDPVVRNAIIGGAVVFGLGLIGGIAAAVCQWRKRKQNPEEANKPQAQGFGAPVCPDEAHKPQEQVSI